MVRIKYALAITLLTYSALSKALDTISWNLESGGAEISTLQAQLKDLDLADIYGFSEVKISWQSRIMNTLNEISTNQYESIITNKGGSDRLLIAYDKTKYKLLATKALAQINIQNRVRPALVGKFKSIENGQEFFYMVNHLYRSNKRARHKQSRLLHSWIKQQDIPVIAVGDYNYDWDVSSNGSNRDRGFDLLTKDNVMSWVEPMDKVKTQCSNRYNGILDFVFISSVLKSTNNESKILHRNDQFCSSNQQAFSDHRPIWARLQFDEYPGTEEQSLTSVISNKQREIDDIYSLLSLAVVYNRWQEHSLTREQRQGHNIGSVLVDQNNKPVFWARNARYVTKNASQHGEVRLITNYLNCPNTPSYLGGNEGNYTLYSSLEPCLMCTGMMALTKVGRGVYVQSDPGYGHVMERLTADHSHSGGPGPYPRTFQMVQSSSIESETLDDDFKAWIRTSGSSSITKYLRSPKAKAIYKAAYDRFIRLESAHDNDDILALAKNYLATIPKDYIKNMSTQCLQN